MDLGFTRWEHDVTAQPGGFAVLLVGIAARQAASPTARAQAQLERRRSPADRLRPRAGAFSAAVATVLTDDAAGPAGHPVTGRQEP